MRKLWLFLVLLQFSSLLRAQELVFCLDHTANGAPLGASLKFDFNDPGQTLDLLFMNENGVKSQKLFFFIDRLEGGEFVEWDTKTMLPDTTRKWAAIRYSFEKSGTYRVMVLNETKKEICRSEMTIAFLNELADPDYYNGSQVLFSSNALDGIAEERLEELVIPSGTGKTITVLLQHYQPLATDRIIVDVWAGSGVGAGVYLETLEFQIKPEWEYTQFDYLFQSAGVFTFRFFSKEEIWICNGVIQVTME